MKTPFRILITVDSFVLLAEAMLGPIYALYVKTIGGDLLAASATFATFSIVAGISIFFVSKYVDRIKEKELVVASGYVMTGIVFLGYIFIQSAFQLFFLQIFLGIGVALLRPTFDALLTKYVNKSRAVSQWGVWEGMNTMMLGVGALVGGIIAANYGFIPLFVAMATLCFASASFIFFLPRKVL